jgi:hypothetical protein
LANFFPGDVEDGAGGGSPLLLLLLLLLHQMTETVAWSGKDCKFEHFSNNGVDSLAEFAC